MSGADVLIRGDGVAARCCAHLLRTAGVLVAFEAVGRARVPAILLSDTAVALLRDVFGNPVLLQAAPRIRKRIVAWGEPPVVLEHSGHVVSEDVLLAALGNASSDRAGDISWTIDSVSVALPATKSHESAGTGGPAATPPALPELLTFGNRFARAQSVELIGSAEAEACWVESLESGWLFLITTAPGAAWLLAVGGTPDSLLGESRLVASQIARCGVAGPEFSASPRILAPLCGPGWLACGSAAMGFDPICGDGTAHAVREAILAIAVIRGGDHGMPAHYEARLTAGFRRHLELCLRYYETGGAGDWWRAEANALRHGLALLPPEPPFRYRLRGFDLEPCATLSP